MIKKRLKKHRDMLKLNLECGFGLLDLLHQRGVLSTTEFNEIETEHAIIMKNSLLLQMMDQKTEVRQLHEFMEALRSTNQSHLASYIMHNGSE